MADKKSKPIAVKKRPIKKKKSAKQVSPDKKVEQKEDSFEIPVMGLLKIIAVLAVIALLVFAGVKIFNREKAPNKSDIMAATVNGQEILWEKIDSQYDSLSPELQKLVEKEVLLNQSIDEILLMEQVELKGIKTNQDDLDDLVARVRSQFTEEQLELTLSNQGMTMDDFIEQLKNRLLVNELLQLEIPELKITEEMVQSYFDDNKDLLNKPEMIRASHILVGTREEAEDILAQIKEGADFAELAKEYSTDGSAPIGGDLGFFPEGVMVPEFEDAVFALDIGEVSDVVETQYGFHIIKVTDKSLAEEANLDELRATIKFNLFDSNLRINQEKFSNYLQGLRDAADIEVFER